MVGAGGYEVSEDGPFAAVRERDRARAAAHGQEGEARHDPAPLRAAGLSAMLLCCAAMIVAVREPAPGPLAFFVVSSFIDAVRGTGSLLVSLALAPVLLWPLWSFLAARRGWQHAVIALQILFHIWVVGYVILRTDPAQRDAILLTSLPLAMAITFVIYDVQVAIEADEPAGTRVPA